MASAAVLNTSQNIDKDSVSNTEKNAYIHVQTHTIINRYELKLLLEKVN